MDLEDILSSDNIYVKQRFDEKSEQYIIMTLCDVVEIPRDVSLTIREGLEIQRKRENKLKITGRSPLFSLILDGELMIKSDGIDDYMKNKDKINDNGVVRIPKDTKKISIESFIVSDADVNKTRSFRNGKTAYDVLCYINKNLHLDFGNLNPALEMGFNFSLTNRGYKDNYFKNEDLLTIKEENIGLLIKIKSCVNPLGKLATNLEINYTGTDDLHNEFGNIISRIFKLAYYSRAKEIVIVDRTPVIEITGNIEGLFVRSNEPSEIIAAEMKKELDKVLNKLKKKLGENVRDSEYRKILAKNMINSVAKLVRQMYIDDKEILLNAYEKVTDA